MPTVLDLLGLADATPAVSGRSLAPALAGKRAWPTSRRSPNRSCR